VTERVRAMFKKNDLNRVAFEFNSLVTETIVLLSSDLQRHQILVRSDLDEPLSQVIGDRIQLQQVLVNLITNAIESMATKDGPRILDVKSSVNKGGGIKVSVADTGTGVDSHDVGRIFDPLFTNKLDGMGMGLSICRSIIEAHSGCIWVTQNQPQGAVFHFVLSSDRAMSAGT
jgi:signal transduction histidine kinase